MDTAARTHEASPDLSFFRAVHRKTRKDLARYVRAVDTAVEADRMTRLQPLARWARGFAHELVHHHRREDDILFPALRERVPAIGDVLDDLAGEKVAIDDLMARWPGVADRLADRSVPFAPAKAEAQALAAAIECWVLRRLDTEDAEVLPVLAANFVGGRVRRARRPGRTAPPGPLLRRPVVGRRGRARRSGRCRRQGAAAGPARLEAQQGPLRAAGDRRVRQRRRRRPPHGDRLIISPAAAPARRAPPGGPRTAPRGSRSAARRGSGSRARGRA